jgi:hypothetical protein
MKKNRNQPIKTRISDKKKPKFYNYLYYIFRSGTFVRACVNNDIHTVEKILQSTNGKEHLNDVNEDGDSVLALACSNGYTDLVRLLLTTIPDIDINDRGTKQDCTPLMEG